jgi:uncharacterized membrane protein YozB (DUF420 family)
MDHSVLPQVNAALNASSAGLLLLGRRFIRQGRRRGHRACMLGAVAVSVAFLAGYVSYHAHAGHTVFREPAWFRPAYLLLLLTHTVLALATGPLVLVTLALAARGRSERHRQWARWTWPLWLYVSVTGVVIYLLLYRIFPQP